MEVSIQLHAPIALPHRKKSLVPTGTCGPQSHSGCFGVEKNLALPGIKSGSANLYFVTILTELFNLIKYSYFNILTFCKTVCGFKTSGIS
jgi:hypothetical protein